MQESEQLRVNSKQVKKFSTAKAMTNVHRKTLTMVWYSVIYKILVRPGICNEVTFG